MRMPINYFLCVFRSNVRPYGYLKIATSLKETLNFSIMFIYKTPHFRSRGYKTFFMLNSTEHENLTAHLKTKISKNEEVSQMLYLSC